MTFVTRFAPSPTGYLHLGHALSALTAFDAAQAAGGRFLLRIEDIDQGRARPEFEAAIYEDLAWLGVRWEKPVRRQSEHMPEYAGVLQNLIDRNLVYRDFRTRKEIADAIASAPHGVTEHVARGEALPETEEEERLAKGETFAWRLSLKRARAVLGPAYFTLVFTEISSPVYEGGVGEGDGAGAPSVSLGSTAPPQAGEQIRRADPDQHGDVVIARKDFPTSYHLASVWDDALQGVTCVIRGEDLREAAHLHVLLQKLLNLPAPKYQHHRLVLGEDGKRLAKRDQASTLRALRESGKTPANVRAMLLL